MKSVSLRMLVSIWKLPPRRKAAEKLKPQVCEVCGTGYLDQEEYEAHLNFRVHEGASCTDLRWTFNTSYRFAVVPAGYKQVRDKFEVLEKKRAQRPHKPKAPKRNSSARVS